MPPFRVTYSHRGVICENKTRDTVGSSLFRLKILRRGLWQKDKVEICSIPTLDYLSVASRFFSKLDSTVFLFSGLKIDSNILPDK